MRQHLNEAGREGGREGGRGGREGGERGREGREGGRKRGGKEGEGEGGREGGREKDSLYGAVETVFISNSVNHNIVCMWFMFNPLNTATIYIYGQIKLLVVVTMIVTSTVQVDKVTNSALINCHYFCAI